MKNNPCLDPSVESPVGLLWFWVCKNSQVVMRSVHQLISSKETFSPSNLSKKNSCWRILKKTLQANKGTSKRVLWKLWPWTLNVDLPSTGACLQVMSGCVLHVLESHDAQPSASQRLEALQSLHVVGWEAHPTVRLATLMTERPEENIQDCSEEPAHVTELQ